MLEKAERALRDEVERQVKTQGAYSGPRNGRPDYVDADLDYPTLCRAVLMAVRDGASNVRFVATVDNRFSDVVEIKREGWIELIDAILNEGEG